MQAIQTEHGIFTNNEITGQTAQEVYAEWLVSKDTPRPKTDVELLKENSINLTAIVLDLLMGVI